MKRLANMGCSLIAACGLVMFAGACQEALVPDGSVEVKHAVGPEELARKAIGEGDCRLRAIRGYSLGFPGVSMTRASVNEKFGGWVVLESYKERSRSLEDDARNIEVADFASRYNVYLSQNSGLCGRGRK